MNLLKHKFLLISGAIIVSLGIGLLLYFILRKKHPSSTGDTNVKVDVAVHNPAKNYYGTTYYSNNDIKSLTVEAFINKSVIKFIPNHTVNDIEWKQLTINNQPAKPTSSSLLVSIFGLKSEYKINGSFQHKCNPDNKISCAGFDLCKGYAPYCDPVKGWICKEGRVCPTDKTVLADCCKDSHIGPVPKCENNVVTCHSCTGPQPSCIGVSGCDPCKGCGPICTSDGWKCQEGISCPTDMDACCTDDNKYPVCSAATHYKVECTKCQGPAPECKPDCKGSGLVCGDDGKFTCQPNITCPNDNVLATCCENNKDKPHAVCDPTTKKITCQECPDSNCTTKSTKNCPKSCQGRGWKCTADGCKCSNNVKCPGLEWAQSNCCPDGMVAQCDKDSTSPTFNSIICVCESGTYPCGSGDNKICCHDKCCQNDPPHSTCGTKSCCSKVVTGSTNKYVCCEQDRACLINGNADCCPVGTQCRNSECVVSCGPVPCAVGEKCVQITNLTSHRAEELKLKYGNKINIDGTTAYLCIAESQQCHVSGNDESAPPAIDNYYPCYSFPSADSKFGSSYCTGKSPGDSLGCYEYKDPTSCGKDVKCQWRDVLKHMSSQADIAKSADDIQTDMKNIHDNEFGNYCSPGGKSQSFQRVVAEKLGGTCDVQDCLSLMAQPSVTDIDWNETTGICSVLQTCGEISGGLNNNVLSVDGNKIVSSPNPSVQNPESGVTAFTEICKEGDYPTDILRAGKVCDYKSGKINNKTYNCNLTNYPIFGAEQCEVQLDGKGPYDNDYCNSQCLCGAGFKRGAPTPDPTKTGCYLESTPETNGFKTTQFWENCDESSGIFCYKNIPKNYYACEASPQIKWSQCKDTTCKQPSGHWSIMGNFGPQPGFNNYCKIPPI